MTKSVSKKITHDPLEEALSEALEVVAQGYSQLLDLLGLEWKEKRAAVIAQGFEHLYSLSSFIFYEAQLNAWIYFLQGQAGAQAHLIDRNKIDAMAQLWNYAYALNDEALRSKYVRFLYLPEPLPPVRTQKTKSQFESTL